MFRTQCPALLRHVKSPRKHIFHARTLSITTTRFSNFDGLVLGVYKDGSLSEAAANDIPSATKEAIHNQLKLSGTKGKFGEVRTLYGLEGLADQVALVSLKEKDDKQDLNKALEKARKAVAIGVKRLRDQGAKTVGIDVMTHEHGAAEGATLALYSFDSFKSPSSRKPEVKFQKFSHLLSASDSSGTNALSWETGIVYGEAQNFARTLAETPANLMTPTIFADKVKEKIAELEGVEVIVRDKAWAEKMGMNAFLSVAKGSDEPCQFMEIWYRGGVRDDRPLALVGKGVTFDSGGISLKPSSKMADMKADMAGGAVVAASIYGIAKLRLPINVVCAIPLCENMPSGKANKPGDVVKAMNGKTIEIDNTDAEGRLILADALYYVSSTYKPHTLVDLATLTGAIVIALGEPYSAVFTNSDTLWNELSTAGNIANDPFWRMPFHSDYRKTVAKSTVADLINNAGRSAGACTAAVFLKEFVKGLYVEGSENADEEDTENKDNDSGEVIRYAHLDIAATMESSEDTGYLVKGMSGRPTRSIIEFARNLTIS